MITIKVNFDSLPISKSNNLLSQMKKIVMLIEELGSQMRIHLALCELYTILFAENVETAMYFLRRANPDLLLLDFELETFQPDRVRAFDFVKKIKGKYDDLKVVSILNEYDRLVESDLLLSGSDSVLHRPLDKEKLLVDLEETLRPTAEKAPRFREEINQELITA